MQVLKTRILWAIYIICAALFFFYYLFPSDAIKEYLADQVRQAQPNLTVKISRLKPAFPPGLKKNFTGYFIIIFRHHPSNV
jgi:hypothetical protein